MKYSKVIAIDGPSGSGKSSISKEIAKNLNFLYVDTGSMYRAIAFWADKKKISFESGPEMVQFLKELKIEYHGLHADKLIEIGGQDLSQIIREHSVSELASKISKISEVRFYLLELQRSLATKQVVVMEGRDIGSVVFPNSFCKIFLTASDEVRAQRRYDQLLDQGDEGVSREQVLKDIQQRDSRDKNRDLAPMVQAEDATLMDTSKLNFNQVVEEISNIVHKRAKETGVALGNGE